MPKSLTGCQEPRCSQMPTDVAAAVEHALPADLALRAHTAQPCRHPPADTYQDYIILPGHINFGAEQVDTSTQARGYPRGGASRARPLSAPVLCAAPRETRRARTVARPRAPSLPPSLSHTPSQCRHCCHLQVYGETYPQTKSHLVFWMCPRPRSAGLFPSSLRYAYVFNPHELL